MTAVDATQFEQYRPMMFAIAYRMLGSASDAEDMVQEAYLRYRTTPPEQIASPKAFLSTIVTRLCLNFLQLARVQRESYIGPWLPEPVLTGADEELVPGQQAELHESLSLAFLVLLEQLTPLERAVFLLREVFDYDYAEIAGILGKTEATCRQVLRRARQHIAEGRPRFLPSRTAHTQILQRFQRAVSDGDLAGLTQLLADEVVLHADGGGKVRGAIVKPLRGRDAVARFVLAAPRRVPGYSSVDLRDVNGELSILVRVAGQVQAVIAVAVEQERIAAIRVIANPDKLRGLNRLLEPSSADFTDGTD